MNRCVNYVDMSQCEADLGCLWDYEKQKCDGSILTYRWSSGTVVWNDDGTRWADLGYFDTSHFDVQVRPSKSERSETHYRTISLPRSAQVFALYPNPSSGHTPVTSLSTNWANCESVATYRDELTIAQANLDNVLVRVVFGSLTQRAHEFEREARE